MRFVTNFAATATLAPSQYFPIAHLALKRGLRPTEFQLKLQNFRQRLYT